MYFPYTIYDIQNISCKGRLNFFLKYVNLSPNLFRHEGAGMMYSESANLAILACPGGEHFADAVIQHLKHIYVEKLNRKIDKLIKRYDL